MYEVATMTTHLAMPRIGHLEELLHIFGFLKQRPKRNHPTINERRFKQYDWYDFYRDAKEAIPGDMPSPRGNAGRAHCFVDADLAGNTVTRRSQTGILIFVNRAPVIWYSKRQNTVEVSTFGSEITTMKNAIELIEALPYKLRMFGVPIDGAIKIFSVTTRR